MIISAAKAAIKNPKALENPEGIEKIFPRSSAKKEYVFSPIVNDKINPIRSRRAAIKPKE